jgi:anti-sigma B factor antagonist
MILNKTNHGPDVVLTVDADRIDAANAVYLKDAFSVAISGETGRIVMDLDAVSFMDSSGLGAVVAAMKQLDTPRKLELCNLQPAVNKVFKLTRMYTVFPIHEDLEAAVSTSGGTSKNASAA